MPLQVCFRRAARCDGLVSPCGCSERMLSLHTNLIFASVFFVFEAIFDWILLIQWRTALNLLKVMNIKWEPLAFVCFACPRLILWNLVMFVRFVLILMDPSQLSETFLLRTIAFLFLGATTVGQYISLSLAREFVRVLLLTSHRQKQADVYILTNKTPLVLTAIVFFGLAIAASLTLKEWPKDLSTIVYHVQMSAIMIYLTYVLRGVEKQLLLGKMILEHRVNAEAVRGSSEESEDGTPNASASLSTILEGSPLPVEHENKLNISSRIAQVGSLEENRHFAIAYENKHDIQRSAQAQAQAQANKKKETISKELSFLRRVRFLWLTIYFSMLLVSLLQILDGGLEQPFFRSLSFGWMCASHFLIHLAMLAIILFMRKILQKASERNLPPKAVPLKPPDLLQAPAMVEVLAIPIPELPLTQAQQPLAATAVVGVESNAEPPLTETQSSRRQQRQRPPAPPPSSLPLRQLRQVVPLLHNEQNIPSYMRPHRELPDLIGGRSSFNSRSSPLVIFLRGRGAVHQEVANQAVPGNATSLERESQDDASSNAEDGSMILLPNESVLQKASRSDHHPAQAAEISRHRGGVLHTSAVTSVPILTSVVTSL
eukprot:g62523.t1